MYYFLFFLLGRDGKFCTEPKYSSKVDIDPKTLSKVDIELTTDLLPYTGGGIFIGLTVVGHDIGLLQMISSIISDLQLKDIAVYLPLVIKIDSLLKEKKTDRYDGVIMS